MKATRAAIRQVRALQDVQVQVNELHEKYGQIMGLLQRILDILEPTEPDGIELTITDTTGAMQKKSIRGKKAS